MHATWLLFFNILLQLLHRTVAGFPDRLPGGNGCQLNTSGYASGLHHIRIEIGGQARLFLLFVPTAYVPKQGVPLWLLAPGAYETPGRFLHVSAMLQFAEANDFAFAVLQGVRIEGMNVGLHTSELSYLPDDVEYTRAILRDVSSKLCVNMDRIRCTGYSRGARFCSRLASELSNFVGGIAPVAGIRYPEPNNATRVMPIIAIHGTSDEINPYWGKGDPSYWHSSVPDAINKWAAYNECKYSRWLRKTEHVVLYEHFDCKEDASVVLVMVEGDGHTWPGSDAFVESQFGHTTHEIVCDEEIKEFFMKHPAKTKCHTAVEGELCYEAVQRARKRGLSEYPDWKQQLSSVRSFEDYQYELHINILADCAKPCPPPGEDLFGQEEAETTKAATSSTDRPSTTELVDTVKAIEGRWMRNTQPGRFTEVIKDGDIHWDVGPVTKITATGSGRFTTQWQGSTYQARLVRGTLIWDDGDVWARVKDGEPLSGSTQEFSVIETRSWRDAGHRSGLMVGSALVLVTVLMVALISLRALRCRRPTPGVEEMLLC